MLRKLPNRNAFLLLSTRCRYFGSIMIFGDSNTWGFDPRSVGQPTAVRIAHEKRWTTLLQKQLGPDVQVYVEALNARTTVFNDPISPCDGDYDCTGRNVFKTLLHSHKPLSLVIIALGTNDLKDKFNTSPHDIVNGVRVLAMDVKRATSIAESPGKSPKILIIGPPQVQSTPISKLWGFSEEVDKKSKRVSSLLAVVAKDMNVGFVNLAKAATVSDIDGVHFSEEEQPSIAAAVGKEVARLLELPTS